MLDWRVSQATSGAAGSHYCVIGALVPLASPLVPNRGGGPYSAAQQRSQAESSRGSPCFAAPDKPAGGRTCHISPPVGVEAPSGRGGAVTEELLIIEYRKRGSAGKSGVTYVHITYKIRFVCVCTVVLVHTMHTTYSTVSSAALVYIRIMLTSWQLGVTAAVFKLSTGGLMLTTSIQATRQ
jgi:hypothetical protein